MHVQTHGASPYQKMQNELGIAESTVFVSTQIKDDDVLIKSEKNSFVAAKEEDEYNGDAADAVEEKDGTIVVVSNVPPIEKKTEVSEIVESGSSFKILEKRIVPTKFDSETIVKPVEFKKRKTDKPFRRNQ